MKHIIRTIALVLVVCMLSVTAFAAEGATPSVEQQGKPDAVPSAEQQGKPDAVPSAEQKDGPEVASKGELTVVDADGKTVESDDFATLVVTAMADAKDLPAADKEKMEKAFTQISEAKSLADIAPELTEVLKELKVETPVEELVVRDLFHVAVSEKLAKALETEGSTLKVSFKVELEEGEHLIVMVQNAEGEWVVLSGDDVVVEDGIATISFPCVGPVAFIFA